MSTENEVVDATTSPATETAPIRETAPDPVQTHQESNRKSIKDTLKAAFEENRKEPSAARQEAAAKRAREEQTGKFAAEHKDGKPPATQSQAKVETPAASATAAPEAKPNSEAKPEAKSEQAAPSQAAPAAPASLSKEVRAIWDTLPDVVRNDIIKREADTAKGVEQLKARYQPMDEAVAPYRPMLQQMGFSEGQAIKQLFDWHQALAGPNKVRAFQDLARSHGVDLSTLAQTPGQSQQIQDPNDPRLFVQQAVQPLFQEINALKAERTRERQMKVNQDIASFSKDKPHFDKVKVPMGQMMASGYAADLDDAYQKATWADPEIRAAILAEDQAKREADAKAASEAAQAKAAAEAEERKRKEREAADKARKANVSPRAGTPLGSASGKPKGGKSVRESLAETFKESRASI